MLSWEPTASWSFLGLYCMHSIHSLASFNDLTILFRSDPLSNLTYLMVTCPTLLATANCYSFEFHARALDWFSGGSMLIVLAPPILSLFFFLPSMVFVRSFSYPIVTCPLCTHFLLAISNIKSLLSSHDVTNMPYSSRTASPQTSPSWCECMIVSFAFLLMSHSTMCPFLRPTRRNFEKSTLLGTPSNKIELIGNI